MTQFSIMTDDDLIRYVETTRDPLTTTALELELAARLLNAVDEAAESAPLAEVLLNRSLSGAEDVEKLEALLQLASNAQAFLDENEGASFDALQKELEAMAAARDAVDEAHEALTTARDALAEPVAPVKPISPPTTRKVKNVT
jgi:hypothetical protein